MRPGDQQSQGHLQPSQGRKCYNVVNCHVVSYLYRVFHLLADLGFDLCCSTICSVLLGQMGFWQKRLSNWTKWWNIPNLSQHNPCPQADGTPCTEVEKKQLSQRLHLQGCVFVWVTEHFDVYSRHRISFALPCNNP